MRCFGTDHIGGVVEPAKEPLYVISEYIGRKYTAKNIFILMNPNECTNRLHRLSRKRIESKMRKLVIIGIGLCALGAFLRAEDEEEGPIIALSPFLAALAIETGIFILRRHQNQLLGSPHHN
jgi:hypothetical protein